MSDQNKTMTEEEERELRNSIFSAREAVEAPPAQRMSAEEYAKKELDLEIPINSVPLPSAGKIYPSGHALHKKTSVDFRAMTTREEDILNSRTYIKDGSVITKFIQSCLLDKNVQVNKLVSGDRNALMIAIRASGYGNEYETKYSCTNCETQNILNVDLTNLPIKPLKLEPVQPYVNAFEFKLPMSKRTVVFQFLTGEEEEKILKTMEIKKKKAIRAEDTVTSRLLSTILEIDGVADRTKISKFVQFMPAGDSLALRKYIDENEPGVDMTVDFQCSNCDHVADIQMPLGPTFFWPNVKL